MSLPTTDNRVAPYTSTSNRIRIGSEPKIALLLLFHSESPPGANDRWPIKISKGAVYTFKPAGWMQDVKNNWLGGSRHGVKLTVHEKKMIEKLPWFKKWIDGIYTLRKKRLNKQCKRSTSTQKVGL